MSADEAQIGELRDRTDEYIGRDLDDEGVWPASSKARYGGVLFNGRGEVLLREPTNHYDGYAWTFPKGAPEHGESSAATALREVFEETGVRPRIVGHLSRGFSGTSTGWVAYFYVMLDVTGIIDDKAVAANGETDAVRWVSQEEAGLLIAQSTNGGGRERDQAVLEKAFHQFQELLSEVRRTSTI